MLASQMVAVHGLTMIATRRLNHAQTIERQDSASSLFNKLARTFAAQIEALKRYRSAGAQTIKVQHVTVNEGGQAIVGNVGQGVRDGEKSGGQPLVPSRTDERGPALLGNEQALPTPMPGAGGPGWTVCLFHRARGGAPRGEANCAWKHGHLTRDATDFRRESANLLRSARKLVAKL